MVNLRNGCGHHALRELFGAGGGSGNKVGDGRENIRWRYTEALISLSYPSFILSWKSLSQKKEPESFHPERREASLAAITKQSLMLGKPCLPWTMTVRASEGESSSTAQLPRTS